MPRPFVRVHYRVPGPGGEPVDRSIVFDTPWNVEGEVHPAFVEAEARRRLADVPVWEAVGWEFAYSPRSSRSRANRAKGAKEPVESDEQKRAREEAKVRARVEAARARAAEAATQIDLGSYDYVIVAFSGGKDSLAALLYLLDLGVDPSRIELWHHDVDGREGSRLMDWPVTRDYVRKIGEALGIRTYFSWKVGGFEGEMLRDQVPTGATAFETPEGVRYAGGEGKPSKKPGARGFPRASVDLQTRWCSGYLKVDVAAAALRNQARFTDKRTLFITGERAQESGNRAEYEVFEPHRTDARAGRRRAHIDHWRPILGWWDREVWAIVERYGINPHPAYRLGWGRVSCAACIFGSADQFASLRAINPEQFAAVVSYEERLGSTIKSETRKGRLVKLPIAEFVEKGAKGRPGRPYPTMTEADARAAVGDMFTEPVILGPGEWRLPAGAFGESCGPT